MTESIGWQEHRVERDGVGFTRYRYSTAVDGPHLTILGAVHGDEVLGSLVAGRLTLEDAPIDRGRLTVIPVTHESAYPDRRVSRADGLNLARVFPGDRGGNPTERLAALLLDEVIHESDALLDLHTSSMELGTDMPLLAGGLDDGSDYGRRCREMALAFGAPVTWLHPVLGQGRSLTSCHEADVPAIYVECPEGGRLQPEFIAAYEQGVAATLQHLRLRDPAPEGQPPRDTMIVRGDEVEIAAAQDGLFQPQIRLLDHVRAGDPVGRLFDRRGRLAAELVSPIDGIVMVLRHRAASAAGDRLVGIALHP